MPELPEVETVVRDLRPLLIGQCVTSVTSSTRALRHPWDSAWNGKVIGQTVQAVTRRGKWILVAGDSLCMLVHLGMTGQLTVAPATLPVGDHTHLRFGLGNGSELRFRDVRRFGSATVFDSQADLEAFLASRLGPEPFGLDPEYFRKSIRDSQRNLKAILLDQTIVAGVGNIYADEACFRAGLHPARTGASLTLAEVDRLREAITSVLEEAIAQRGSTIRNYIGGSGLQGGYQNAHAVYGRTGQPCPHCGTSIACTRLAGRSSHYCPRCQSVQTSRKSNRARKV